MFSAVEYAQGMAASSASLQSEWTVWVSRSGATANWANPAIAFPPKVQHSRTVPHIAAQHVPHEGPLPDPFFGNTLTDSGDSSAYVRALDPGKMPWLYPTTPHRQS